ncbi:MAG: hypothetical protein AB9846_04505 [Tenuifilaceae bacterium]
MSTNRWYSQFMILFGAIMTFFYIGVGLYFILSTDLTNIDKFIRYLVGGTFVFYGLFRLYRTFVKIKEEFFSDTYDED